MTKLNTTEKEASLSTIKNKAIKGLPLNANKYHSVLPTEIAFWHIYASDCGHNVLALLPEHENLAFSSDIADYLIPVPVIAVLESHRMRDGIVILTHHEVQYNPNFGLLSPERMDEY